jgi:hypothetical protein
MPDDRRPLTDSSDDLPRRVRGVNWRVPGQSPPPQAGGQLPKRVPGLSAFRPTPRLARVRSVPVVLHRGESPRTMPLPVPVPAAAPAYAGPRAATSRAPASMVPVLATVLPPEPAASPRVAQPPRAPAAAPRIAQPPPARAQAPRRRARARAWRWWLAGLLIVVLATAAVLAVTL